MSSRKFIDCIKTNQVSKVARYLEKGFDPNFHISNDGKSSYSYRIDEVSSIIINYSIISETALSCACVDLLEPRSMILTLVNGGVHLDFRTRNGGLTPLHKSAIHYRKESIVVS